MSAFDDFNEALDVVTSELGAAGLDTFMAGVAMSAWGDIATQRFLAVEACDDGCDLYAKDGADERSWVLSGKGPDGVESEGPMPLAEALPKALAWCEARGVELRGAA